ncbi:MAG: hypothetical protein JST00_28680 [Deltaproteobacteria bacterium]|nr:hypothetical protein [Deltaproteobacteria bacterium]
MRWVCLEVTGGCTPEREAYAEAEADAHAEAEAEAHADAEADAEPEALAAFEELTAAPLESGIVLVNAADGEGEDEIIVEELEPLGEIEPEAPLAMVATETLPPPSDVGEASEASTTVLPPAPDDPFTALVCRLADIAIGAGSPEVAGILPALLMDGRLTSDIAPETTAALSEAGIVVDGAVTKTFAGQTEAWRAILRGTSDDFDATGGAMLDEWAADLLACLLGTPARGASLRKDLRARGVAAFGLVAAA